MVTVRSSTTVRLWIALAAALVLANVTVVRAHGFNVGFIAPLSGSDAHRGQQGLDGFLLATRERDGHAFEESDGHLGGLDSYVLPIDSRRGTEAVRGQLDELFDGDEIVFLTGVSVPETLAVAGVVPDANQSILVDPLGSAVYRSATSAPESLVTMDGMPFSAAFREAYGYEPGVYAISGYVAARFIAAAVSATEGRFERRAALHRALARARENLL
jgi:ABC-type branched-subunit amino acid transport system substrate-binding protein